MPLPAAPTTRRAWESMMTYFSPRIATRLRLSDQSSGIVTAESGSHFAGTMPGARQLPAPGSGSDSETVTQKEYHARMSFAGVSAHAGLERGSRTFARGK